MTINIAFEGNTYTLTYNRRTVMAMEKKGFNINDIDKTPMTTLPELFKGSFLAKHPFVKDELVDKIYDHIPNKQAFVEQLGKMYAETLSTLMKEPDEGNEGNAVWEVNE